MAADKLISSGGPWEAVIGYTRPTVASAFVHVATMPAGVEFINPEMLIEIEVDAWKKAE